MSVYAVLCPELEILLKETKQLIAETKRLIEKSREMPNVMLEPHKEELIGDMQCLGCGAVLSLKGVKSKHCPDCGTPLNPLYSMEVG